MLLLDNNIGQMFADIFGDYLKIALLIGIGVMVIAAAAAVIFLVVRAHNKRKNNADS